MEKIITIELLGEHFKFKADKGREVDAEEVGALLVNEVNAVASRFPAHAQKTNKLAIVVMAALNIAKRYMELSVHHGEFVESVSRRADRMDRMLASRRCN